VAVTTRGEHATRNETNWGAPPLFAELSREELEALSRWLYARSIRSGDLFSLEGERSEAICFVVSGLVKLFKVSAGGKEQILEFVHPGQFFNESAVLGDLPNPVSSEAVADTVVYCLNRDHYEAQLQSHPEIASRVTTELCARARRYASLVEDLSLRTVAARVAKLVLDHGRASLQGRPYRLTHQQMAAMAGAVRESVARALKELENARLISGRRHRIVVLDAEGLERVALAGQLRKEVAVRRADHPHVRISTGSDTHGRRGTSW
jgi:CRP/FNR family transcriptional regulator